MHDGDIDVVVACNGCTDETADIARAWRPSVTVLDLPAAGKSAAIRAAEAASGTLPRLYLDADVLLPGPSAVAVLNALRDGAIAARPPFRYDTTGASRAVRRFYRQRMRLPGVARDLCGAGVYGLSRTARERFGEFPTIVADDLFAARIVDPSEVCVVPCAPSTIAVPRTVSSLVTTLSRTNVGNRELRRLMPDLAPPTTRATAVDLLRSVRGLRDLGDAVVYACIVVLARLRSVSPGTTWGRDETTRGTAE